MLLLTMTAHPAFSPRRTLAILLAFAFAVYLGDLACYQLRLHVPKLGPANGSVHRIRLLAIPGKANKVEYQIDALRPEEDLPCSRSLFPHAGISPCWYVKKHANDPISM